MELTEAQNQIASDEHRFRVVICGRKFGKTTIDAFEILYHAIREDNQRVVYFANTLGEARDIIWNTLKQIAGPVILTVNETRLELTVKTRKGGKSLIILRGWESVETSRGTANDFIVCDEFQNYKDFFTLWQEVLRPTLIPTNGKALFTGTPKGFNHAYDLFNVGLTDENFKSFKFTTYDNPHIKVEEIDEMKKQMSPDKFAQEVMAEFKKMEGLVYPEFSRETQVYTSDSERGKRAKGIQTWYAGVDFGYTNPTAVLKIGKRDDEYYLQEEWVKTQTINSEMIEYVKTMNITRFYPDSAEPDRVKEMRNAGLYCADVNKDIALGIDVVHEIIRNKKLYINAKCVNTLNEIESYHYPDARVDRNKQELPMDLDNHCMDAMRYCLFMLVGSIHTQKSGVHYAESSYPRPTIRKPKDNDIDEVMIEQGFNTVSNTGSNTSFNTRPKNGQSAHFPSTYKH